MNSSTEHSGQSSLPGVSSDGSPVPVYRTLPATGEPELIHEASAPGAAILELGCGAGRVTHALIEREYEVVAVDNCAEMLRWVRGAATVLSDIETLNLDRRFETVVLGSHLINTPDERQRQDFLETCRRHLAPDGIVLVQRYAPDLLNSRPAEPRQLGDVEIRFCVRDVDSVTQRFSATVSYAVGSQSWEQNFEAQLLHDDEFAGVVQTAGLAVLRWLDEERTWAVLRQ